MGDSQSKFAWQYENTVHSVESQTMNMGKREEELGCVSTPVD